MERSGWLLALLFAIAAPGAAANHYVRSGASGNASGSDWTNACTDFTGSCAPSSLVRGDTYYVADGSYANRVFNRATSGTTLITIKKATGADHGTDSGWQSTYGDGQAAWTSIQFATSYWVWDGATGGGPGNWTTGFGFRLNQSGSHAIEISPGAPGASNITLRHFEILGNLTQGAVGIRAVPGSGSVSNMTVQYFYMNGIGNCPFLLVPVTDFIAEFGYVGTFTGNSANHSETASIWGGSSRVTFRYNIITHADSTGGLMMEGDGLYLYGNVFYHPPGDSWTGNNGLAVGTWTVSRLTNAKVYNNSFVNIPSGEGPVFGNLFTPPTTGNEAKNNLFYNVSAPISYNVIPTHDYNHYINSGGTHSEANGTSAASGNPFVNISNLDFHLVAQTSAGVALPAPFNKNPDGVTRGASGVWTKGAYEYTGAQPPRPNPPTNLVSSVN